MKILHLHVTLQGKRNYSALTDELKNNIDFLMAELDRELAEVDVLIRLAQSASLDQIQTMAGAVVIHGMYTGIESIFLKLYQAAKGRFAMTEQWHRTLLDKVGGSSDDAIQIISKDSVEKLNDYLAFRHRFRHNYGWKLNLMLVQNKLQDLPDIWQQVKKEIQVYLKKI